MKAIIEKYSCVERILKKCFYLTSLINSCILLRSSRIKILPMTNDSIFKYWMDSLIESIGERWITGKSENKNRCIFKRKDKTAFLFWQHFVLTFLTASRVGQKKWTKKWNKTWLRIPEATQVAAILQKLWASKLQVQRSNRSASPHFSKGLREEKCI